MKEEPSDKNADLLNLLLVQAALSGDPEHYDPERPATHPYFPQAINNLKVISLIRIFEVLDGILESIERQVPELDLDLMVSDSWDLETSKKFQIYRIHQTAIERLWHLRISLIQLIDKKIENTCEGHQTELLHALGWKKSETPEA